MLGERIKYRVLGPFSPGDSLRLYRLQRRGISLIPRQDLTQPFTPLREAWLSFVTQQAMGQPTYVLYDPHDGEAFVQIRYRPHQAAADVAYLAPTLAENHQTGKAWLRLLDGASFEAARRGIQRIFASLPESGAEVDVFQQAGFSLFTSEDIYRLTPHDGLSGNPPDLALEPQRPEDWASIQRLRVAITPQRVRQAEGGIVPALSNERNSRRLVLRGNEGNDLIGEIELCTGSSGHWMHAWIHPDWQHIAEALIRRAVQALDDRSGRPIYCDVRQYESGLQAALDEVGFQPIATRALMAKPTLAWVKTSAQELAPVLKSSAEPVPPTYRATGEPDFQTSNGRLAAKQCINHQA